MKKQDVLNGTPFKFKGNEYQVKGDLYGGYYVMRYDLKVFVGNVDSIKGNKIKLYQYMMEKRVTVTFDVKECTEVTE